MEGDMNNESSGVNCTFEHFSESKTVNDLLDDAVNVYDSEQMSEMAHEKLKRTLNQYIDQPHLLDLYIEQFLCKLISYIKDPEISLAAKQEVFRYMFLFINVRGYKVIVRLLPHEVSDLELALSLLEQQYNQKVLKWETRYCLLLWLSIIVMIPFDMSRLDKPEVGESTALRILNCCKNGLVATDKSRDAAAFLCARFATRNDIKDIYLDHIIQWACDEILTDYTILSWKKFGPLIALSSILKYGKREEMKPYTAKIFECIVKSKCLEDTYRLSRKYAIKIFQRIGLCHLKVKLATWRYVRGSRSLALMLNTEKEKGMKSSPTSPSNQEGDAPLEECTEIDGVVEEVVAQLLKALRDEDITTRWSAAKGVGRVTDRLSAEFCNEIVENILSLFSTRETSCSWNGACLALAELGRRGLLLPSHLPVVVKVLLKALVYEETHGIVSAGSYVRDSACYTCWSLARAFDPEVLKPYVNEIAGGLLIVASFDREMNCRKAASAAFQEHVGRQGTFPHGIDILTIADYFAVSVRRNAFLNVSAHIVKFTEYTRQMIDHLVQVKVGYWDAEVRDLTSKALYKLLPHDPFYVASKMEDIVKNLHSMNLNLRHGSILSLGEIIHSLATTKDCNYQFDDNVMLEIKHLVRKYQANNIFRGVGGDLMKEACCFLIQKCCLGYFPLEDDVLDDWNQLIEDCIPYEHEKVRLAAASALSALVERYYVKDGQPVENLCSPIIEKCRQQMVSHTTEAHRIGYAIVLGIVPKLVLRMYLPEVIESLTKCATKTDVTCKWVYARKAAIESLIAIWKTFYLDKDSMDTKFMRKNVLPLIEVFLISLDDYTVDRRGDIGSFVRESSVRGLQVVVTDICRIDKSIIHSFLMQDIVIGLAKQALDKISRIRISSTRAFIEVLNGDIPEITNLEDIKEIFFSRDDTNWSQESNTFPLFAKLMQYSIFTRPLLSAFIKCVGSVTESLVKYSISALIDCMKNLSHGQLKNICVLIVEEFRNEAKEKRLTKSMFVFLERMFACDVFTSVLANPDDPFAMNIFNIVREEVVKTKDSEKLTVSVEIFCQLLQVGGEVTKNALSILCKLLCHRMIWLRKTVALRFTEAMMMYAAVCGLSEESEKQIINVLTEFDWENSSIVEIRKVRNDLCMLLDISTVGQM